MADNSGWKDLYKKEDWWAVWLGLGIVILGLVTFLSGSTIKGWAVTPGEWSTFGQLAANFNAHVTDYLILFAGFLGIFTLSCWIMGYNLKQYIPGFIIIFIASLAIFYLAGWEVMQRYDLGAPLMALAIGLVISNIFPMPKWLDTSLRTEYYIKTGIVLLGATLPLTLIFTAGPVAFLQATIVSVTTFTTIFLAATKIFKMRPQLGAVLGAGGSVCGVSAAIAVGGAIKAKKDEIAISIGIVSIWAIVMIFALSFVTKALIPDTISPGVAGAWVGTSEFADAAGFAVVAELANTHGDAPVQTFTLMKVIGRDIWIGIWALALSIISVAFWERKENGVAGKVGAGVVWQRFPKFVFGFFVASIIMSFVAASPPADHVGVAGFEGVFSMKNGSRPYHATFNDSTYTIPAGYEDRLIIDQEAQQLRFNGLMSQADLQVLQAAVTDVPEGGSLTESDQRWALMQLRYKSDWFDSVLKSRLISPVKKLRSWAFVFCFLCIGLSTRFKELATFGMKPLYAFTMGVIINVPLGYFLSTVVFRNYWDAIR